MPLLFSRFRQAFRYFAPTVLLVVGGVFGLAALYHLNGMHEFEKRVADANRNAQEAREQVERQSNQRPDDAAGDFANMLTKYGGSAEAQSLGEQVIDSGQKFAVETGVALATGLIGLIWLSLMSMPNRMAHTSSGRTILLATLTIMIVAANYGLILRHRATNQLLFPSCFPILAGGLLPLFLLQPVTVWIAGTAKTLTLFAVLAVTDLIAVATLYSRVSDPMSVLLGFQHSDNSLNESWYICVMLAQWGMSIFAFFLAWRSRS